MNLGDGLVFELENGKPRVILLSHGGEKNPGKPSVRLRAAHILGSRPPPCQDGGGHREGRSQAAGGGRGAAASVTSHSEGRSSSATMKTQHFHKAASSSSRAVNKLKMDELKHSSKTLRPPRANGKPGPPRGGGEAGLKVTPELKDGVAQLTVQELRQILNAVQTPDVQTPDPHQNHKPHQNHQTPDPHQNHKLHQNHQTPDPHQNHKLHQTPDPHQNHKLHQNHQTPDRHQNHKLHQNHQTPDRHQNHQNHKPHQNHKLHQNHQAHQTPDPHQNHQNHKPHQNHQTPNTDQQPVEEAGLQGAGESEGSGRRTQTTCLSLIGGGGGGGGAGGGGAGGGGGGGAGGGGGGGGSQEKDKRSPGCMFSWMGEREADSRAAIEAKNAQWRRDLDEQVAQKQQLQAAEDAHSPGSVQSWRPAADRSSLKLNLRHAEQLLTSEVRQMEEVLSREEQRRRWLEELDRQRVEATERRRQEKLQQQNQTEDLELWTSHFDSMQQQQQQQQRPPPGQPEQRPPPGQPEQRPPPGQPEPGGEWEPSSSLSLVWDTESVGGTSVNTAGGGHTSRTSYLRTMTSLLDPAQVEERERRRRKQQEQQRAIEEQMEERRQQREREEARRRREEEEEERRVALEREVLQKQYEQEAQRSKQKSLSSSATQHQDQKKQKNQRLQETREPDGSKQTAASEDGGGSWSHRDAAVQTEATGTASTGGVHQAPPPAAPPPAAPPPAAPPPAAPPPSRPPPISRSRAARTGKENICLAAAAAAAAAGGGGGDLYQPFARTERRDKRRPEWNTQRPSRRFVPASERYPVTLQRNRQESRLKRQAELRALQERTCPPGTGAPPPAPPPQHQELRLCSGPAESRPRPPRKKETDPRRQNRPADARGERGRSPPASADRHQASSSSSSSPAPPPVLEFLPYVRTDEVFNLDPLEDTPPPLTHSGSPPAHSHSDPLLLQNTFTPRQQEILRGLAQLRQGLLQKQRELETDLNPLLRRHDNEHWSPSATHYM